MTLSIFEAPTPIGRLIHARMQELRLRRGQVAARLGYENISKGARRLEQVSCGDLAGKEALLAKLPRALNLPEDVVAAAVEETRSQIEREIQAEFERQEARWRARFRPHALISTERSVPSPIFMAIFIGPETLKRVNFDASLPVAAIHEHVQDEIRRRQERTGQITCFGKATGYVLNWTPDRAERFDLAGNLIEVMDRAQRLGEGVFRFRGTRAIPGPTIRALIGPLKSVPERDGEAQ
jgi:hypothetical protein